MNLNELNGLIIGYAESRLKLEDVIKNESDLLRKQVTDGVILEIDYRQRIQVIRQEKEMFLNRLREEITAKRQQISELLRLQEHYVKAFSLQLNDDDDGTKRYQLGTLYENMIDDLHAFNDG